MRKPAIEEVTSDNTTALGTLVDVDLVSSERSAAASNPVRPHAPSKSERAKEEKFMDRIAICFVADSRFSRFAFPLIIQITVRIRITNTTPIISVYTPMSFTLEATLIPKRWIKVTAVITPTVKKERIVFET